MKKVLLVLALVCLLLSAMGGTAGAQAPALTGFGTPAGGSSPYLFGPVWASPKDVVNPTVTAIAPTSAPNDRDTAVTITGTGFATDGTGTFQPTASLGETALTDVTFVDATTLTATVPRGIEPGVFALTVTNPDGGSGSLNDAFAVTLSPTVTAVDPASALDDQDTAVTISGTDFATAAGGTILPTVSLGTTSLPDVTFVDATTLTATVPLGLAPRAYTIEVTNPDGGNGSMVDAFTVLSTPTVSAIDPPTAYNDIDIAVTITGTDFVTDATGTVAPTVTLGTVALRHVTVVDPATMTASVPFDMDPGTYDLTMVNPDGGTAGLPGAFTVTQGFGQWNGGKLFGGQVQHIMLKPGDPNTVYALAGDIGLFRSRDAGESWTYVSGGAGVMIGEFTIDPLHPDWLYAFVWNGIFQSKDEGDTWTMLMSNTWPDGRSAGRARAYPSPHDPQVLFVSSAWPEAIALGLVKSTDAGASWKIVADMKDVGVEDVAYDPTDPLRMVLVTSDGRVFQSTDGGDAWSEVTKPPLSSGGVIAYNPYKPGEVWVVGPGVGGYKSTDAAFSGWQDVGGGSFLTFTGPDSVYTTHYHSTDGGTTWDWFGPTFGYGELIFDQGNPQIGYLGDNTYGVQKTTDGGDTWDVKNQGLAGLVCGSMDVSSADPLRVFAAFGGSPGIYRSDDGASNWRFFEMPTTNGVRVIRIDPFDPLHLYAAADGFCVSPDGGKTWSNLGWNLPPSSPIAMRWAMEPDPFQEGHLLLGMVWGDTGWLYSSSDSGVSWQAVTLPQDVGWINGITFDPDTPGLVYVATGGTGVYRSTDGGSSWARIDDLQQSKMQGAITIAIAAHPQHVLYLQADGAGFRSFDGGATWERTPDGPFGCTFVDEDSTRLYSANHFGLYFSSDVGESWEPGAGALGSLQIMAFDYVDAGDHTILYAATNGGQTGADGSAAAAISPRAAARTDSPVAAGVYRYVVVKPTLTLRLSGLSGGALRLGRRVTAKGVVTPTSLAGVKVTLTVQRRRSGHWRTVTSLKRTIGASGAYSRTYRPAKRGSYRVQATIAMSATNMAAKTSWRTFRVK